MTVKMLTQVYFYDILIEIENTREGVVSAHVPCACQVNILIVNDLACLKKRDSCITFIAIHDFFLEKLRYMLIRVVWVFHFVNYTDREKIL